MVAVGGGGRGDGGYGGGGSGFVASVVKLRNFYNISSRPTS